ncbi:ATP-binding cassette domain-containing protein [Echinicola jeungdonensis]|uniref:ABC transporter ATP-binding protein n=1 Tax=Echinicola jeungdonensis TaxID=709343 RepID=A0ABV5J1L1_9BACT|nr:ATP-binding cassette domain-containing protein [Echinicola jeungdonensis]MDN3668548.1 ATP-binding cassette domain-containing protein [Echinicola jeungdonensis]
MDILKVEKLNKKYGQQYALTDLDLKVPSGSVFGLLGPNGAGKTTLIRIINQIIGADSGEVLINEAPLSPRHIQNIGYLPEERGLYKRMKVGEQLLYLARLKGLSASFAKEKVAFWLDKLDMAAWREKKVEDLSKGMAQKVQFVATVIHSPKILILDEPFSGFDPVNAELIKNEILELRDQGVTIILSTHRMESVELLCDHIAMIHQSRKVLDGPVKKLKNEARTDRFAVKLKKYSDALPFDNVLPVEREGVTCFDLSLSGKSTNEVLRQLLDYGEVLGFEEVIPSIGEIFIQKVKEYNYE